MKLKIFISLFVLAFFIFTTSCNDKNQLHLTPTPNTDTSRFTDPVNGDVYKIVKIGNQWWMAENLKATKYNNGKPVLSIQSDSARWANDTTGASCIYDGANNPTGLLYNWYAVNNPNKLAPQGWHIPTDAEWKALEEYIGMSASDADNINWRGTDEAEKLKIESPNTYWTFQGNNIWSTNESGFTALAGSCRLFNAKWGAPGLNATGFWWTATPNEANNKAWYRYMDYKYNNVFRNNVSKNYGFSVRCVKDY